jgi:hypothetical protein
LECESKKFVWFAIVVFVAMLVNWSTIWKTFCCNVGVMKNNLKDFLLQYKCLRREIKSWHLCFWLVLYSDSCEKHPVYKDTSVAFLWAVCILKIMRIPLKQGCFQQVWEVSLCHRVYFIA